MESVPVLVTVVVALAAVVYTVYLYKQEVTEMETRLRMLETHRPPGISAVKKYRKLNDPRPSDVHSEGAYTSLHRSAEVREPDVPQARVVEYKERAVETDPYSDRERKRPREEADVRDPRDIRKKALAGSSKSKQDKVAMYLSTNFQRSKERFMATIGDLSKKGKNNDRRYESPKAGKTDPLLYTSPSEVRGRETGEVPAKAEPSSEKPLGSLFGAASAPPPSRYPVAQPPATAPPSQPAPPKDPPSVAPSSFGALPTTPSSIEAAKPPPSVLPTESLFGPKPSEKSERPLTVSLFGKTEGATAPSSLFTTSTVGAGQLFGGASPAVQSSGADGKQPLFGAIAAGEKQASEGKPAGSLFGDVKQSSEKKESLMSLFATATQSASAATEKPAASLFTLPPTEKQTSAPALTTDAPSLFGNSKPVSLFGSTPAAPSVPAPSLFPSTAPPSSTVFISAPSATPPQFGAMSAPQQLTPPSSSSLFGTPQPSSQLNTSSLFTSSAATQASPVVFGPAANKGGDGGFNSPLFGQMPAGFAMPKQTEGAGKPLFGGSDPGKSLFGPGSGALFPGPGGTKS